MKCTRKSLITALVTSFLLTIVSTPALAWKANLGSEESTEYCLWRKVEGEGTGNKVEGEGTGKKVEGEGTGKKVEGEGTGNKSTCHFAFLEFTWF